MAIRKFISLRKQQRNGLNGTVKSLNSFPYLRRKVFFFIFKCFLLTRQVYGQKGLSCRSSSYSADKNAGSVAGCKKSSSCSILFPIYLKGRISAKIFFQICLSLINF